MRAKDAGQTTEITWERYDRRAHIFSDEGGIVRRLLRHPLFEEEQVLEADGEPIAVEGTFPIGAVKLCSMKRQSAAHARVLAYDAEEKRRYAEDHYGVDLGDN